MYFRYLSINSIGDAAIQRFPVRQQPFIKPTSDLTSKITGPLCRFLSLLKQLTIYRLSLINIEPSCLRVQLAQTRVGKGISMKK